MGVFALGTATELFRAAAIAAAHDLGVYGALAAGARTADEVADAIGIHAGRHRLGALLDALAFAGALGEVPPRSEVIREGWGRLAEVIRSDRPLVVDDVRPYHAHLVRAGADAARELASVLGARSLLDIGGGAGAYTAAILDADPSATATLVDAPEVIPLARDHLARFGDRVRFVAGDARSVDLGGPHDVALLANVLHLHGPSACTELCAAAARATAPGGTVCVLDLRADSPEGVWFALDMALYTASGTVHPTSAVRGYLAGAGLETLDERGLAAAHEVVVVTGRRLLH